MAFLPLREKCLSGYKMNYFWCLVEHCRSLQFGFGPEPFSESWHCGFPFEDTSESVVHCYLLHTGTKQSFVFPFDTIFGSCYGRMFDGAILRRRRNSRNIVCLFKEGAGLCELLVKRQFPISHTMPWLTALSSRGELTCFRSKLT